MSYAMKVAKANAMGDPGLFGFIGKAIGSVAKVAGSILPGPLGGIAKVVGNVLVPAKPIKAATIAPSFPGIGTGLPVLRQLPDSSRTSGVSVGGLTIGTKTSFFPGAAPQQQGGGMGGTSTAIAPCDQRGFHRNRTGYYTQRYGWIEKGSVCVKNRRRNPLNPRALSRALARLTSAKKAVRCLGDFTVRSKKACGCR